MRMIAGVAVVLSVLFAGSAGAVSRRDIPTPVVRVTFERCGVLEPRILIKVDGASRYAKKVGDYYEADFAGHPVDATKAIVVPEFADVRKCCWSAEEFPVDSKRTDWYVMFTVTCDKPTWKLSVDSGVPIRLQRAHRNELGDASCDFDGSNAIGELSSRDDAILTLPRNATEVKLTLTEIEPRPRFDLKIRLTELLLQADKPYDREHLGQLLKREVGRQTNMRSVSGAAEPLVDMIKSTLPNSVTLRRQ